MKTQAGVGGTLMRLYGRDPNGRYYPVRNGIWGPYREQAPRGLPGKPVLKLLLLLAVIIVIASFV